MLLCLRRGKEQDKAQDKKRCLSGNTGYTNTLRQLLLKPIYMLEHIYIEHTYIHTYTHMHVYFGPLCLWIVRKALHGVMVPGGQSPASPWPFSLAMPALACVHKLLAQ